MNVRLAVFGLGFCLLAAAAPSGAADHLVTPDAMHAQLMQARLAREADIAAMERALDTSAVREAAQTVGASMSDLRAIVPTLSNEELADLTSRARALEADPVAGMTGKDTVWVILIVIAVLVVLGLLAAAAD